MLYLHCTLMNSPGLVNSGAFLADLNGKNLSLHDGERASKPCRGEVVSCGYAIIQCL